MPHVAADVARQSVRAGEVTTWHDLDMADPHGDADEWR
jgi:hypothetical protein